MNFFETKTRESIRKKIAALLAAGKMETEPEFDLGPINARAQRRAQVRVAKSRSKKATRNYRRAVWQAKYAADNAAGQASVLKGPPTQMRNNVISAENARIRTDEIETARVKRLELKEHAAA